MSTYGIIFCGYRCADLLADSLAPWLAVRERKTGGHTFKICAVSVPFKGFDNSGPEDETREVFEAAARDDGVDFLIARDTPMTEVEARGEALRLLVAAGVDILWQWDADEVSTIDELERIVRFVESRPFVTWFRGSLKNYVFDRKTYLLQPFTPPRIHRVVSQDGFLAADFAADNDLVYGRADGVTLHQNQLPHMTIPKAIQFTPHYSWLSDDRSKRKIDYQLKGRGWPTCSFAWDDTRGGLIWRDGQPIPEVAHD